MVMLFTFLVYETKFTARKSQEVVFTAGKRRGCWTGNSTLVEYPKRCPAKTISAL